MSFKLITIEGIDCSGKTTISKKIAKEYNSFIYQHEPTFSSEEADALNFENMDSYQREFYFMKDRLDHQKILNRNNVILDRYILSGLVYAATFSPESLNMMKSIYKLNEFKKPSVTIIVLVRPKIASKINRNRKNPNENLDIGVLTKLQNNFANYSNIYSQITGSEVFFVNNNKGCLDDTIMKINTLLKGRLNETTSD